MLVEQCATLRYSQAVRGVAYWKQLRRRRQAASADAKEHG